MKAMFTSKKMTSALLVAACLAGLAYWQRQPVLAWYYVRQLSYAYEEDRDICAKKVASLQEGALPRVFARLQDPDAIVCGNMQHALLLMTKGWGMEEPRTQHLVESVNAHFEKFSPAGREKTLLLLTAILQRDGPRPLPPRITSIISDILIGAEKRTDQRGAVLLLAAELVDCVQPGQWVDVCRGMAERGIKDAAPGTRVAALQLLSRQPMRKDKDLLGLAIPLFGDESAAVRRACIVALASESEVVREEHFLPLLHDDDHEVQYLSQIALRKRGLNDDDLIAAQMIGDKNPATRMRVLQHIHQMPEANLGEWLRRLSQDPAPAVRAAAVRAAGENSQVDLSQRLREMAAADPSETVRQNAQFYLQQRMLRTASDRR
jgi:HEAT repeats